MVFSALMIAACVALSRIPSIRVTDGVRIGWGFLARATCALVGGPVNALIFGLAEDTISYLLNPTGPYFPGYALTTMIGTMVYALFLYRTKVTVWRIFLAKLCNNIINVFLGSLWSAILYSKGYLYYVGTRMVTNSIMLPIQAVMLTALYAALIPALIQLDILPAGTNGLEWKRKRKKKESPKD
jgi:ECF transporter S component (folate family)